LTKRVTEWIEVLGGTLKDAAEDIAGHTYWGAKNRGALEAEAGILGQSVEVRHLWKRITQVLPVSIAAKGGSLAQWISSGPGGPMFFVKVGESMTGMNVESYSYETCLAEPIKTMTQAMLGQAEPNEIIEMLKNKEAWMCLAALGMSGVDEFESRLEQELEVCVLRSESVGTQKAYDKFRAQTEKKRLEAALREEGEQGSGRSGRL
jgi:hypothetical protein